MPSLPTQIPPSPVARSLLTFAKQGASGVVRLSGRRVGVREGFVTGVAGSAEDPTAEQWLSSLGQLAGSAESRAKLMRAQGSPEWEILAAIAPVGDARRTILTLWVVRLSEAIAQADARGASSTVYLEGGQMARAGALPKISLARLCLEALSRIAARSDMSWLNPHLGSRLRLSAGPLQDELTKWLGVSHPEARPALRDILYADPSATVRLAALLRAGVAVIESEDPSMPPPPLERSVSFSTAPVSPRKLAFDTNVANDESLPPPPAPTITLDDPLCTLEAELDILESSRASGAERAEQWKEIAACWETRFGSLSEASRAYRHAAAAAPDDYDAHRLAAEYCARIGRLDLARSHAYAAFALCKTDETRCAALRRCASYAIIDDNIEDALTLLRQASEYDPESLEIALVRWSLLASLGRLEGAADAARLAARLSLQTNPRRSRALLGWAHNLRRDDVDLAQELAASLCALEARSAGPWLVAQSMLERQRRRPLSDDRESSPLLSPKEALSAAREQVFGRSDMYAHPDDALALRLLAQDNTPVTQLSQLLKTSAEHPGIQWLIFSRAPQLFFESNDPLVGVERVRKLQASIGEQIATLRYLSEQPSVPTEARRRAHELLCEIAPYDPTLILHRVRFLHQIGDTEQWRDALTLATNNELFAGDDVFFDALGAPGGIAPETALHIFTRRGRYNERLGAQCIVAVMQNPTSTLQHQYQALDLAGDLVVLAKTARDAEDWAAEARAWLRILEDEPLNDNALRRLTQLYTDAGQAKRAYATLCIRLSQTDDLQTRADLLTQIARWAKYHPELEADPESLIGALLESSLGSSLQARVLQLIDAMFQDGDLTGALLGMAGRYPSATTVLVHHAIRTIEDDHPHAAEERAQIVLRALSIVHNPSVLIPVLEHFVEETKDPEVAKRGFQILKQRAMGRNGRRALAYREGRILLRVGRERDALQSFAQAFALLATPAEGNIYAALQEVSRRTNSWEALAEAQLSIAEASQVASQRRDHLIRAAKTFEEKLNNPTKAFEIYLKGWKSSGDSELEEHAKRVARKLKAANSKAAVGAFGEIIEHLRSLSEGAWDEEERIDKLSQIATLYATDCDAPELASATVEEAVHLAESAAPHRIPQLLCELGTWLLDVYGKHEKCIDCAERALRFDPNFQGAKALLERARGSREVIASYPAVHTSVVPVPDTSRPAADLERLREAARAGDLDAAAALRDILTSQGMNEEAAALQRRILLQNPRRLEDLTRLFDLANLSRQPALESLTGWLLQAREALENDARVTPPPIWPPPPPFTCPADREIGRGRQLLAAIWRHLGHRWGAIRPGNKTSLRARRTPTLDISDFGSSFNAAMHEPDAILLTKANDKEIDALLAELGGALGQLSRNRTMPTDLSQEGARELSAILSDYEVIPAADLRSYVHGRCACLALETCSNLVGALRYFVNSSKAKSLDEAIERERALRLLIRHILSDRAINAPPRRTTLAPAEP